MPSEFFLNYIFDGEHFNFLLFGDLIKIDENKRHSTDNKKNNEKPIFSKFLRLSGNDYHRIRCGFGVLFPSPNHFNSTLVVFEKNRFFDEKIAILPQIWSGVRFWKIEFFTQKKSIFSKFPKLSGNDYNRIRCGFGVLFPPLNYFNVTLTVFEQKYIFDGKNRDFCLKSGQGSDFEK